METNKKLDKHPNYFSMEGGMHEMFIAKEEMTGVLEKKTFLSLISKKDRGTLLANLGRWIRGFHVFKMTGGVMCPYTTKKAVQLFRKIYRRCWNDNYLKEHIQRGVYHNLGVEI